MFKLSTNANVFMLGALALLTHIVCKNFKIDKLTTKHWTNRQHLLYFNNEILISCAISYLVYGIGVTEDKISSWGKEAATSLPRTGCDVFNPTQPMIQF